MRVKRMHVAPELLVFMGSGKFQVVRNSLPHDAKLRQTTIDPVGGWVTLFIESEEFTELGVGEIPPVIDAPIIARLES